MVSLRPFDLQKPLKRWDVTASRWQVSSGVPLKARRRYYIETMYSLGALNYVDGNFLKVGWKRPQQSSFEIIEDGFLSLYTNDSEKGKLKIFDHELPDAKRTLDFVNIVPVIFLILQICRLTLGNIMASIMPIKKSTAFGS